MFPKLDKESELCKYIFHLILKLSKLQSKQYPYFQASTEYIGMEMIPLKLKVTHNLYQLSGSNNVNDNNFTAPVVHFDKYCRSGEYSYSAKFQESLHSLLSELLFFGFGEFGIDCR